MQQNDENDWTKLTTPKHCEHSVLKTRNTQGEGYQTFGFRENDLSYD